MGKASRWFRGLLGLKKSSAPPAAAEAKTPSKDKKRWGFVRSSRDGDCTDPLGVAAERGDRIAVCMDDSVVSDPGKHAIAVAAATAAVAEAAVAAAHAAAAVVELTSSSGRCPELQVSAEREECSALMIQAAFRGYLARRALKALKGLVKLQALVRGYIVRKQTVETLRCMQALVRVQSLVRAQSTGRSHCSEKQNLSKSCSQNHPGPATPEKYECSIRLNCAKNTEPATLKRSSSKSNRMDFIDPDSMHMDRNFSNHWMDEQCWDPRETPMKGPAVDKILEVDLGKPNYNSRRRNANFPFSQSFNSHNLVMPPESSSKDSMTAQLSFPSPSSIQVQTPSPLRIPIEVEDSVFDTAQNSPQFYSASSKAASTRRGPFTPSKSDCSQSFFSVYSDYPNYMADTESSRAKFRSHSAPKQRPKFEKSGSTKRLSDGCRSSSLKSSSLQAKFTSKAYPGSGRLDRLGMPTNEMAAYNTTNHSRW